MAFLYTRTFNTNYRIAQKVRHVLISPNIDRFSKFFHRHIHQWVCNKVFIKDPIPYVKYFTTLLCKIFLNTKCLLQIHCWMCQLQNFANLSIFDEVMKFVALLFWDHLAIYFIESLVLLNTESCSWLPWRWNEWRSQCLEVRLTSTDNQLRTVVHNVAFTRLIRLCANKQQEQQLLKLKTPRYLCSSRFIVVIYSHTRQKLQYTVSI